MLFGDAKNFVGSIIRELAVFRSRRAILALQNAPGMRP